MPTWLKIYLVGFIVALHICLKVEEDDRGRITFSELWMSFLISLFSWITVLMLWIGSNINFSEKHRNDNLNKKKKNRKN
jgi:hypothetical protein